VRWLAHGDIRELASPGLEREDGVGCVDAIVERCSDETGNETDSGCNAGDAAVDEGVVSDLVVSVSIKQAVEEGHGVILRKPWRQSEQSRW
jgi:hypothetical protein